MRAQAHVEEQTHNPLPPMESHAHTKRGKIIDKQQRTTNHIALPRRQVSSLISNDVFNIDAPANGAIRIKRLQRAEVRVDENGAPLGAQPALTMAAAGGDDKSGRRRRQRLAVVEVNGGGGGGGGSGRRVRRRRQERPTTMGRGWGWQQCCSPRKCSRRQRRPEPDTEAMPANGSGSDSQGQLKQR